MVSETTEATNNILDQTVANMLKELGEEPTDENTTFFVAGTNNLSPVGQQELATRETVVFNNALSTVQRLQRDRGYKSHIPTNRIGS